MNNIWTTHVLNHVITFKLTFFRLLLMWIGVLSGHPRTWSKQELPELSAILTKCNITRPSEIHRSIRTLDHINFWKGTEFRIFLLYLGIVVLKKHLSKREYEMFLNLYCAVTVCSSSAYQRYLPVARKLFIDFIETHIEIHKESSITMNIHNTSHVVDDVETFGPLDTFSAYEFENTLHHLKLRLKQCNSPLQQIARRLSELANASKVPILKPVNNFPKFDHPFTVYDNDVAFKQIDFKQNAMLSSRNPNGKDKWFLTHDNVVVEFHFVVKKGKKYVMRGSAVKNLQFFFEKPFDSKHLNIFLSDGELHDFKYFQLNTIKAKMFCLPFENKWIFVPLLHTL